MTGRRRVGMFAVLGVAAAFLVVGCGGGGGEEQGGGEGGSGPTATIVSDLPLQGSARARQETIANAITLALEDRDYMAGDVQIEYISQDDATAQAGQWDEAVQLWVRGDRDPDPQPGQARDGQPREHRRRVDQAERRAGRARAVLPDGQSKLYPRDCDRRQAG